MTDLIVFGSAEFNTHDWKAVTIDEPQNDDQLAMKCEVKIINNMFVNVLLCAIEHGKLNYYHPINAFSSHIERGNFAGRSYILLLQEIVQKSGTGPQSLLDITDDMFVALYTHTNMNQRRATITLSEGDMNIEMKVLPDQQTANAPKPVAVVETNGLIVMNSEEFFRGQWKKMKSAIIRDDIEACRTKLTLVNVLPMDSLSGTVFILCYVDNDGKLLHHREIPIGFSTEETFVGHTFVIFQQSVYKPLYLFEIRNDKFICLFTATKAMSTHIITLSPPKERQIKASIKYHANEKVKKSGGLWDVLSLVFPVFLFILMAYFCYDMTKNKKM